MSKLYVNEIVEANAGAGVAIPGHVIQMQFAEETGTGTASAADAWATVLSVTITPKYANSKFIIQGHAMFGNPSSSGLEMGVRILSSASGALNVGDASGNKLRATLGSQVPADGSNPYYAWTPSMTTYDTPNTTSPVTYSIQCYGSESQNVYYNRVPATGDGTYNVRGSTTIMVMEIAQ